MVSKQVLANSSKSILERILCSVDTLAYRSSVLLFALSFLSAKRSPGYILPQNLPKKSSGSFSLFNFQGPVRCVFSAAPESDYITYLPACQELFSKFFSNLFFLLPRSLERLIIIPPPVRFVNTFFWLFCFLFVVWQKRTKRRCKPASQMVKK